MNPSVTIARGKGLTVLLGIATLALLALAPAAFAGKIVDRVVVGTQAAGTGEGQFGDNFFGATSPAGLAFNDPTVADGTVDPQGDSTDGYLYVTDPANHRVQAFDAAGNFKFTFGRGVLSGGDGAEVCDRTQVPCGPGVADDEAGELAAPRSIAINQQSGDLYVYGGVSSSSVVRGTQRIDQFAADGNFIRAWGWGVSTGAEAFEICEVSCRQGIAGSNGGQFRADGRNGGVAVDPSPPHHVFFADNQNSRIQEFEADGDFVRLWGWDVVNGGQPGDVSTDSFEVCASTAVGVCKAGLGPSPAEDGRPGLPQAIVLDADGVVYVSDLDGIKRFDSDAATPAAMVKPRIDNSALLAGWPSIGPVSVSPQTGNLLVAYSSLTAAMVSEFDLSVEPPVATQLHLENFPVPAGIPQAGLRTTGFAVDPVSGDFYFSGNSELGHRIFAADDDGATPAPTLAIDDPSSTVSGPNATFSGEVTPNGPPEIPTTYNFAYRKVGSGEAGWIAVPGSENPLGDGVSPVAVSDDVGDLQPNSDYEVRLEARKAFGNPQVQTEALAFTSAAIPPQAKTISPQARSATGATLAALINPNNTATSYYFEWGTDTAYGNLAPIPAGEAGEDFGDRLVTARIEGLQPETTYHYRVVADNGVEVSPGESEVEGDDVAFTTRAAVAGQGERGYEMVTPPFKATRQTGFPPAPAGDNPNPAIASLDGDSVHWNISIFALTDDVASTMSGDRRIIRRTAGGWVNSTRNTLPLLGSTDPIDDLFSPAWFTKGFVDASSGDFETLSWNVIDNRPTSAGLLPTEGKYANRAYTRRDGTGTKGFTAWLTNPEQQITDQGFNDVGTANLTLVAGQDTAILNDSGSAMARWGHYRGLAEDPATAANEDPSDDQQLEGQRGGATVYAQRAASPAAMPGAAKELVSACTGTVGGGDATLIPARLGSGAAADTIGTQTCTRGRVTNVRGAILGDSGGADFGGFRGRSATALADDGSRIFFQSPDRFASTAPTTGTAIDPSISACAPATGSGTACPPQLFVRQYESDGDPVVRWISHSRSEAKGDGSYGGAPIAAQQVAEIGAGVRFEGASRDGSVVYFRTDAPLTPDDPNGGESITTAEANPDSWDLYRYALPSSLDADPSGGTLMRVSGGPAGEADPGVVSHPDDASIRFHSDDGDRAYFLTSAKTVGAGETPPSGGSTAPGGAPGNSSTRNLYLFDAAEAGGERWKFIARLPFERSGTSSGLDACASSNPEVGEHLERHEGIGSPGLNCFRGTPSGQAVLFATTGQLTADDLDQASDIYLYDAEAGELVRITAPPPGASPYFCNNVGADGFCNGELGRNQGVGFFSAPIGPWELSRGWGGMRYYNLATDSEGVVSAYFATRLSLVPEDTNGDHMDVYEWRAGELSLISPGNTADHSWYSGNSLDGRDVFFNTGARLDPRELDDADFDVYDARIGGGFPYTPPPVPCEVLAFACEVEAISGPAARSAATESFSGQGNLKPQARACGKSQMRRDKRCVSKAALARKRCRKVQGKAKRRCVRKQMRKLSKAQKRQRRRANAKRRASR